MYDAKIGILKSAEIVSVIRFEDSTSKKRVFLDGNLSFNEILFRLNGRNETFYNNRILINSPNTAEFLPKMKKQNKYYADIHESGECIDIFFETKSQISENPFVINLQNSNAKSLFVKLEKIWSEKAGGYYLNAMSVFYEILYEMELAEKKYNTNSAYSLISPAEDYINKNYCNININMQGLADMCGISYSYFKRLFAEKYGMTPVKYITQLKMDKAIELLRINNTWNITQISSMVGYDNVYYFSKVFKDIFGCSPTKYNKVKLK